MQAVKDIVIGGDFEIAIPQIKGGDMPGLFREGYFYSSGRAALYAILRHIEKNRPDITSVLVPDYICHSVPETIECSSLRTEVYHLTDDFAVPPHLVSAPDLSHKAILLVNYFGLMSLEPAIRQIHAAMPDCIVIEDNVQSLTSMFGPSTADYRFTSLRKSLPVPDGGWVKTRFPMDEPDETNTFAQYKIAGGILKGLRGYQCLDDILYLKLLETGENKIDENLNSGISNFSKETLSNISIARSCTLRMRNAEYLVRGLQQLEIEPMLPYRSDRVPLFIPIRLKERNKIRRALFSKNIFCPIHWPVPETGYEQYAMGRLMQAEELSLIVDQRYGTGEMQMILDTIKENI